MLLGFAGLRSAWAAILLYHAGMLLTMLVFRRVESFQMSPNHTSPLYYLTTLIFASGGLILYLLLPLFAAPVEIAAKLSVMGLNDTGWIYFAVYFCLVNSVLEEVFWRAYLASDTTGLHAHDVFFGGYHGLVALWFTQVHWALLVLIICTFAGWLWRRMRGITGNLTLPILTHIAADASIIAAIHSRLFTM